MEQIRQLAFIFGVGMVPGAVLCADQTTKNAKSTQEIGFTLDRTKRSTLWQQLLKVHIYDQSGFLRNAKLMGDPTEMSASLNTISGGLLNAGHAPYTDPA
jgi:hypothetical protein